MLKTGKNMMKQFKFLSISLKSLLTALLLWSLPLQADRDHFIFALPFSGDKGSHYDIQLGFANNEIKKFHIPDDCENIINMFNFGAANPVNLIDRKLWFKSVNDCRYVMMLHMNQDSHPENDFVADYDFFNAHLADLPFSTECKGTDEEIFQQQCEQAKMANLPFVLIFHSSKCYSMRIILKQKNLVFLMEYSGDAWCVLNRVFDARLIEGRKVYV